MKLRNVSKFAACVLACTLTVSMAGCDLLNSLLNGGKGKKPAVDLELSENELTLEVGLTAQLTATVDGEESDEIEWYSDDENVCSVENGLVTAVGEGETEVFVFYGTVEASCEITVTERVDYTITISPSDNGVIRAKASAHGGEKVTVFAVPDTGYELSELTCNGDDIIAEMSFIMPYGNVTLAARFTELDKEVVTITPTSLKLKLGEMGKLTATTKSGDPVTWRSGNENIVKVVDGNVATFAVGKTKVYAECNGEEASADIEVVGQTVNPDPIVPDPDDTEYKKDGYTLTWHDEFNGTTLDSSKWGYQVGTQDYYNGASGPSYWGNSELQYYTDGANIAFSDGALQIIAKRQQMGDRPFTSARIVTRDKFSQTFGYFEARMKTPTGNGMWPAFWLLPQPNGTDGSNNDYGGWAANGEIDIMEAKGRLLNKVDTTIHFGGYWPENQYLTRETTLSSNTDEWHTYAVDWTADYIEWYVDGRSVFRLSNSQWWSSASSAPSAPFDKPFYILLNFAVGGTYDPTGTAAMDPNFTSATMYVDYVRVWQKN